MSILLRQFEEALYSLNRLEVKNILLNPPPQKTLHEHVEKLLVPAMESLGKGWEEGKISMSQVYMSGRICEEIINDILPAGLGGSKKQVKVAIAVLEDFHMLGKRIVYSLLRANGFNLIDYNRVSVDELVELVINDDIDIILISVLMLPSALRIKDFYKKINKSGKKIKIVVGGAPFNFDKKLWEEVGADVMGNNASDAMKIIKKINGSKS